MNYKDHLIISENCPEWVLEFARRENLPIGKIQDVAAPMSIDYTEDKKLTLFFKSERKFKPFCVDFEKNEFAALRKKLPGRREPLIKALGGPGNNDKCVLDLTGGWLKDSHYMACAGFKVLALERNPVVYLLSRDGLDRWKTSESSEVSQRIQLMFVEAKEFLEVHFSPEQFYCLFYDPMFLTFEKGSLPTKEIQILKDLVAVETVESMTKFLQSLLKKTNTRVVVKRPRKGKHLITNEAISFFGKSVRYDVYLTHVGKTF